MTEAWARLMTTMALVFEFLEKGLVVKALSRENLRRTGPANAPLIILLIP